MIGDIPRSTRSPIARAGLERHRAISFAALVLLPVAQQVIAVPGSGRLMQGLQNALHGPWFAVVTWLVLQLVGRVARGRQAILATVPVALVLALGSEALQLLTGRDASWSDVGLNLLGTLAALCIGCSRIGLVRTPLAVALASLAILASAAPFARAIVIEAYQASIAPDLVRIDSPMLYELLGSNGAIEVVEAPGALGAAGKVLKVTLAAETWPGVHLDEPIDDWRPYSALVVDAIVDGVEPLPITLGFHFERPAWGQIYDTIECKPGVCRLALPFASSFDPAKARIRTVVVHSTRPYAGRVFYITRVGLQK